jgi:transmembrane sensor
MEDDSTKENLSPDSKPIGDVAEGGTDKLSYLLSIVSDEKKLNDTLDKEWSHFQSTESVDKSVENSMLAWLTNELKPARSFTSSSPNFTAYKIAASFIAIALCSALLYYFINPNISGNYSQLITVNAGVGEIKRVVLPDSSKVWINSGSSISYNTSFNHRTVQLYGEAYFEIVKSKSKKFQVSTRELNITVLGTSFTVNSFTNNESQISVAEGKVKVETLDKKESQLLIKGQAINYSKKQFSEIFDVEVEGVSSWVNNVLIFDDKTFEEVSHILERKFGKEIIISTEALKHCQLSLHHKVDSLSSILTAIQFVTGCKYQYVENKILVSGAGCKY